MHVRTLNSHAELQEAVELQRQIWNFADVELLPLRLFVVAEKIGGQVLGGFDENQMVGFCLAIPGLKPGGEYYLHSHMLGVLPEYRNSGLGRQIKLKQREDALKRGIKLIEWTFDPLELKNAYFNIQRLGATVRRFVQNQYGTTTSHLHGGLPTDRCTAEWWIDTPRVQGTTQGHSPEVRHIEQVISVPAEIGDLRQRDPARAREIQRSVGASFMKHFAEGLAVLGFEKTETAGNYLLGQWESS
jgi:predicted GNAT superfamily acetyltransferase